MALPKCHCFSSKQGADLIYHGTSNANTPLDNVFVPPTPLITNSVVLARFSYVPVNKTKQCHNTIYTFVS